MAVKNYLGVKTTLEVKKTIDPNNSNYFYLSANGITVRVLKNDWTMENLNAKIAF